MKDFFSEYGFVILAALVVVALLLMVSPLGSTIKGAITDMVNTFTNMGKDAINSVPPITVA